jgi:hypothetical protein
MNDDDEQNAMTFDENGKFVYVKVFIYLIRISFNNILN